MNVVLVGWTKVGTHVVRAYTFFPVSSCIYFMFDNENELKIFSCFQIQITGLPWNIDVILRSWMVVFTLFRRVSHTFYFIPGFRARLYNNWDAYAMLIRNIIAWYVVVSIFWILIIVF